MMHYEMQPPASTFRDHDSAPGDKHKEGATQVHQRNGSKSAAHLSPAMGETAAAPSSGSQRKSFTESLRRRFGSMRKKKASSDDVGH
jgi:hypothetical protein